MSWNVICLPQDGSCLSLWRFQDQMEQLSQHQKVYRFSGRLAGCCWTRTCSYMMERVVALLPASLLLSQMDLHLCHGQHVIEH